MAGGAALAGGPIFAPAVWAAKSIKLGYVSPQTGPLAAFAEADNFVIANFMQSAKGGLKIGSMTYPVKAIVKDSQSDPKHAAEVAKELIVDSKVDLMLVGNMPQTTNPVSTQCEIEGVPCVSTSAPWQPYFIGRQANSADPNSWKPFDYTYHFFWGLEDIIAVFTNMWSQIKTNRPWVACSQTTATDVSGATSRSAVIRSSRGSVIGLPIPADTRISPTTLASRSTPSRRRSAKSLLGAVLPEDFATFWNQAGHWGFKPKAASIGKAILFPEAMQTLGKNGNNLSKEVWWSPYHPFKSSLNGMSAKQVARAYQQASGKQWTEPLGFTHALFEVAADVMKRAGTIGEPKAILEAIRRPSSRP